MSQLSVHFRIEDTIVEVPDEGSRRTLESRVMKEPLMRIVCKALIDRLENGRKGVIDLGAWKGDNAVPWALRNPEITVYAIDPSPANTDFITAMCEANEVQNVRVLTEAVSDSCHRLGTLHPLEHCMFTRLDHDNRDIEWTTIIMSSTLDTLHASGVIDEIGFIHLDVEGLEQPVVKGGLQLIKKFKPLIVFEQHVQGGDTPGQIVDQLAKLGYRTYLLNEILPACRPDCRNMLALPEGVQPDEIIAAVAEDDLMGSVDPAYAGQPLLTSFDLFEVDPNGRFVEDEVRKSD